MSIYNNLASLLTVYFCNEFYEDGIKRLKHDIEHHENYAQVWEKIVISVLGRNMLKRKREGGSMLGYGQTTGSIPTYNAITAQSAVPDMGRDRRDSKSLSRSTSE
jgi:hypothetical protein